jgi:hypothetical protein
MSRRKPVTRIVTRKYGYAVIRYGHVQFRHKDIEAVLTFLSTFDPEKYAREMFVRSGRAQAVFERLLAECDA